jgi:hypothetical protein
MMAKSISPQDIYRKNTQKPGIEHFIAGSSYYTMVPILHVLVWTFFVLPSTAALPATIGAALVISQIYFAWQFTQHSDYYQKRWAQIQETLHHHWDSEKTRLTRYAGIFIGLSVITAIASLIMKEVLQDLSGQLISFSYLSLPILFTALAVIGILTVYFAAKPMLPKAERTESAYLLAKVGSYLTDAALATGIAAGCGYCFAIFYAPFLPSFSVFALPTTLSIVTLAAIAGAFIHVFVYIASDKEEAAASFQQVFIHLFRRENSLRRIYTSGQTLIANSLWGGIAAAALFSTLHFLPIELLPALSPLAFVHTLPWIIVASIATQAVIGLFESAATKLDYQDESCTQQDGFVRARDIESQIATITQQQAELDKESNKIASFDQAQQYSTLLRALETYRKDLDEGSEEPTTYSNWTLPAGVSQEMLGLAGSIGIRKTPIDGQDRLQIPINEHNYDLIKDSLVKKIQETLKNSPADSAITLKGSS